MSKLFQNKTDAASAEFLNLIRSVVQEELANRGQTILCQVAEKKDDRHYDLYVYPDKDNIIHNVINTTRFDLQRGDQVYVHKINNQLNNAFIISKVEPYTGNK